MVLSVLGALCLSAAHAQDTFPQRPIKLVVPFAHGGGVDQAARLLARQLQINLAVPVLVENRAGASGTIGGKFVQSSAGDGYTLLFSAPTHIMAHAVLAAPPYDPIKDFKPVARVGKAPLLLVIPTSARQKNLREVLADVKVNPNGWTAALPGLGAPSHLATLQLARVGNVNLTMTPYRGTALALADVVGGHVQILLDSVISLQSMAKSGKVKAIATTSTKRSAILPDVETVVESGFPGLVYESWYGVWGPKGLADERVRFLNLAINRAVQELNRSGQFAAMGIESVTESAADFNNIVAIEYKRGSELLKNAGYKPQ